MVKLFGKPCVPDSFLDVALTALGEGGNIKDEALSLNLQEDDRVGRNRRDAFVQYLEVILPEFRNPKRGRFESGEALKSGLRSYFEACVQWERNPHFLRPELNEENFIPDEEKHNITGGWLVRLMNLNGLYDVFMWAVNGNLLRKINPFKGLARTLGLQDRSKPDRGPFDAWLNDELTEASGEKKERIVRGVLELLKQSRAERAHQPTWATSHHTFRPYLEEKADRWSQVLGVDHREESSQWLVLLVYPVSAVKGKLVRPSQLDAGPYPRHHPLKAAIPVREGGHPMDLRIDPAADKLLPEFVHAQIDHDISHFQNAGSRILQTHSQPVATDILRERELHRKLLKKIYDGFY